MTLFRSEHLTYGSRIANKSSVPLFVFIFYFNMSDLCIGELYLEYTQEYLLMIRLPLDMARAHTFIPTTVKMSTLDTCTFSSLRNMWIIATYRKSPRSFPMLVRIVNTSPNGGVGKRC